MRKGGRDKAVLSELFSSLDSIRSDEGLTLETSAFRISVRWPIYIINSVDKTKLLYSTSLPHLHNAKQCAKAKQKICTHWSDGKL